MGFHLHYAESGGAKKALRQITPVALSVLALVTVAPEAQATGTPITTCGQTVTTDAMLTQDLVCTGSSGIIVGASGITIDLNGHVIRGDGSEGHYGIYDSGYGSVSVENGALRNFVNGIRAIGQPDKFGVSNVVASGNGEDGIAIGGLSASITSSTAAGNGGAGMAVGGASASIKSSTASRNAVGILVSGDSASIGSSTASGNAVGILVSGDSALIKSSTVSGNGDVGIEVAGDAASVKGNSANGNGFFFSDLVGLGIWVYNFTTAPVGTNVALGNDDPAECDPASLC